MARIPLADDGRIESRAFYTSYPALGAPSEALLVAVYSPDNPLPPLVREAVRMRIAVANDCLVCRGARLMPELGEAFYDNIGAFRDHPELYGPEIQAAVEFAELFATDHLAIDETHFAQLSTFFSDDQVAALGVSCAYFSAFGRLTRVMMLDHACPIEPPVKREPIAIAGFAA